MKSWSNQIIYYVYIDLVRAEHLFIPDSGSVHEEHVCFQQLSDSFKESIFLDMSL